MEKEIKKDNLKEKQVVFLRDFPKWEKIINEYRCGDVFFCQKCDSSIICLCEEFNKNNIANSIASSDEANMDYKKIVLECGNCHHKDILIKFLKSIDTFTTDNPWNQGINYPRKKKPFYQYKSPLMLSAQ